MAVAPQAQNCASDLTAQRSIASSAVAPLPSGWNSAILCDFPELSEDFKKIQFTLLWRGSRDRFPASDFHIRCDRRPNTLTLMLDMDENIFGTSQVQGIGTTSREGLREGFDWLDEQINTEF
jgi:hypothetical protein